MANVGDVTVRLNADLAGFTSGMSQAQAQTSRIGVAMEHLSAPAFGATRGLREMEFAMRTMAVQSIGATGGLGNMAAGLSQMILSGPLMLGVLAAFAAVGAVLEHLKKNSDELAKSLEDERKVFQAHLTTINQLHPTESNYAKLVAQLTTLQQAYNEQFGMTGDFLHDVTHKTAAMTEEAQRMRQTILAIAGALSDMNGQLQDERLRRWLDALAMSGTTSSQLSALTTKIQALTREMNAQTVGSDRWAQLRSELVLVQGEFDRLLQHEAKVFALRPPPDLTMEALSAMGQRAKDASEAFTRSLDPKAMDDGFKKATEGIDLRAFKKLNADLKAAGRDAIGQLVRGMVEGTSDFGDLLKNAILQLVETSIVKVITKVLKIASPSQVAYGWGQNIVLGLAGGLEAGHALVAGASGRLATAAVGGSPSVHLTVNVPPSRDPFSMARDADWQRAYRETALVAAAGGFKVP